MGLKRERRLVNFLSLKREALLERGLDKGFMVIYHRNKQLR